MELKQIVYSSRVMNGNLLAYAIELDEEGVPDTG